MNNKSIRCIIYLMLSIAFCPAMADEAVDKVLEEVVVSALRESSASDVNANLTVLDESVLREAPLDHVQDLVQLVPNMNWSGEGSRARYFQLRGIGELEQYEGAPNPSVGFIVDDIDLSGVGGVSGLFDIGRVEVLRGPQATRFGANALGGLVYLQSVQPGEPGQEFELTLGNDNTRKLAMAASVQPGASTRARVSLSHLHSDGFYDNQTLGVSDSNERDEWLLRAGMDFALHDQWQGRLNVLFADFDNGYDAWSPENGRVTYSDNPGRDEQRTLGASLRVQGPAGDAAELVSITGLADSDILFSYDGEWGDSQYWAPYGYDYIYQDVRERQTLSQEFRLVSTPQGALWNGDAHWVVGVYFQQLEESNQILSAGSYDDTVDAPFSYCPPCIDRSRLNSDYRSRNLAMFGKLDFDVSEQLSASLGVRAERWSANYQDLFVDEIWGDPANPPSNAFDPDETLLGGEFSLSWSLDSARIYTLISRGYKAGGFNPSLARVAGSESSLGAGGIAFEPESLLNIEAGIDGAWLDGRLRASFSVFRLQRSDMQVRSSAQFTDNPNDFIFVTSNARGRAHGIESSVRFQVNEQFSWHADLGWLSSRITQYGLLREADIPSSLIGRNFAHAPEFTANLGFTLADASQNWRIRLDVQAMDGFYFDYSHDEKAGSRQLVNVAVSRAFGDWELSAWVRNAFDEDYHTRGFSFGLQPPFFARERWTRLGDPRHFGISFGYHRQ